jgi:hypothetical protein
MSKQELKQNSKPRNKRLSKKIITDDNAHPKDKFAFVKVMKEQNMLYNFTTLNKYFTNFYKECADSILELEPEKRTKENFKKCIYRATNKIYGEFILQTQPIRRLKNGEPLSAKKPMNPFIVFCTRHREDYNAKYPEITNQRMITRLMSRDWKTFSREKKEKFIDTTTSIKNKDY